MCTVLESKGQSSMTYDSLGAWASSIGWMRRSPIVVAALATFAVSVLLILAPSLDRAASGTFYTTGVGFGGKDGSWVNIVRTFGIYVNWAIISAFIAAYSAKLLPKVQWQGLSWNDLKFLTAAWALGPGLVVNGILKSYWGRARPIQTDWFGGKWPYSPPWLPVDHCAKNCSFVSGEAAASFCLLALAFVVPRRYRTATACAALLFAAAIGWVRIAAGGHYLSDVVIAWGLMLMIILVSRQLFPAEVESK
jgi:lipid A 4'-phosphatase